MAFWRRRSRNFEPVSPQTRYTVTYLGHEEMSGKVGLDNTLKPVDDLFRQFKTSKARSPSRMQIEIVNNGIRVQPVDEDVATMFVDSPYFNADAGRGNIFFPIHKLSFGAADPFHTRVFCFVSRNDDPSQTSHWDCHAVLCDSTAMAKNLTLYLVKAFQRISDAKEKSAASAQKSNTQTTIHILRERGTLEYQMSKKKSKRPPVSTIKVTLNIEGNADQLSGKQLDENRTIADILAKQRDIDVSREAEVTGEKDNGNTVITSNFDKENADDCGGVPQKIVVTVAVNPEMDPSPDSPRKGHSPATTAEATSSGEENDVQFVDDVQPLPDRTTSPQDMITTMSPPDTPGYLSPSEKDKTSAFSDVPTKANSPVKCDNSIQVDVVEPSLLSPTSSSEQAAPTNAMRRTPSPTHISSESPQRTTSSSATPMEAKNAEKKLRRERKSVRFADGPELIR